MKGVYTLTIILCELIQSLTVEKQSSSQNNSVRSVTGETKASLVITHSSGDSGVQLGQWSPLLSSLQLNKGCVMTVTGFLELCPSVVCEAVRENTKYNITKNQVNCLQ